MTKKSGKRFLIRAIIILAMPLAWSLPSGCLAIENSECMDCHGDESLSRDASEGMKEGLFVDYNRFKFSIHNINGIDCVDCHADIEELNFDNEVPHSNALAPVNCGMCHEAEELAYQNSVHKKAGGKGITIPCYACHGYHFVSHLEANSVFERENIFCLRCHNPDNFHDWLPQKQTHFSFVECAVCHSPDAPRHVALRFFDLVKNKFLDSDELLEALNTDIAGFMPLVDNDRNGNIDLPELESMVLLLRQKNVRGTFHGELVVTMDPTVHHVNRGGANRDCEQCHNPESPFFSEVHFCLNNTDGTREHFKVDRKVLESYYVNHFYALGGTRVRLLDKIGIALVVGGLSLVTGHLGVRIATIPQRRRRQEQQKKKA